MAETEPKKKGRIRNWFADSENRYLAGLATFYTVIIGGSIYTVYKSAQADAKAVEAYNEWYRETNDWINQEHNSGNDVYQLTDGRFLTVPRDAPVETHIK